MPTWRLPMPMSSRHALTTESRSTAPTAPDASRSGRRLSALAVAADLQASTLDLDRSEHTGNLIGGGFGNLHEGIAVGDLDCTDRGAGHAGLVRNRADKVSRSQPDAAATADE